MATQGVYDVGTLVKISVTVTVSGTLTDATTMVASVRDPNGAVTTPAVVHDSVGLYHANVDTTGGAAGQWWYAFRGTGTAQGAEEDFFTVELSRITS